MDDSKKILLVEDEFITVSALKVMLEGMGFDIVGVCDTGERAIEAAGNLHPDVILMDIILKTEMTGIEAAYTIKQNYDIPVIYVTGQSDEGTIAHALETEPFGYIVKPFEEKNLKTSIKMALYKHEIDQKLKESERKYRAIAELSQDLIFIFKNDGSISYINTYAKQFFQIPRDKEQKIELQDIFSDEQIHLIKENVDTVLKEKTHKRFTLHGVLNENEYWLDTILVPIISGEGAEMKIIGFSRDITLQSLFTRDMEKKGIIQIEHNMEQFQILNDEIRNPLSIIMSAASLNDSEESDLIIDQVDVINNLVDRLDHGWLESEKVRAFLIKHFEYGKLGS